MERRKKAEKVETGCYLFVTLHDFVPRVWPHAHSSMCVDVQIARKDLPTAQSCDQDTLERSEVISHQHLMFNSGFKEAEKSLD